MPCSGSQDWGIYLFHFGLTHVAYAVSRMHVLSHDLYQQPLLPTVPLFMHDLWFAVSFFHFHGELNWATLVPRFFPTELTSFSFRIADGCRLCLNSDFWVREWSFWAGFRCWVILQLNACCCLWRSTTVSFQDATLIILLEWPWQIDGVHSCPGHRCVLSAVSWTLMIGTI